MSRLTSLIKLINSLSRSERKEFSTIAARSPEADFVLLYNIINRSHDADEIKSEFAAERPNASLASTLAYLYELLLELLAHLRRKHDSYFMLLNQIQFAKALFEKSMIEESLEILARVKKQAQFYNNSFIQLLAQRLELNHMLSVDFGELEETELLNLQTKLRQNMRNISRLNEQSALYELLRLRNIRNGSLRSFAEIRKLDDLVTSELSIVASTMTDDFEIKKNHQLFQASYFIAIGDYKAAFKAYIELNKLFEENRHLWNNPPIYYLLTIEGMLESLRLIRDYDGLEFFLRKINELASETSKNTSFTTRCTGVAYIYRLMMYIDKGDFSEAAEYVKQNKNDIFGNSTALNNAEQVKIAVYSSWALLCNGEPKAARSLLRRKTAATAIVSAEAIRIIRLLNLLITFELGDIDLMTSQIRSLTRFINHDRQRHLKTEQLVLKFISESADGLGRYKKEKLRQKLAKRIANIKADKYEKQFLQKIDFTAFIEAKIESTTVAAILNRRQQP